MNTLIEVSLFRHAQSTINLERGVAHGRCSGAPLTSLGEEQAECLRDFLATHPEPDAVFSSTAERALQTAIIAGFGDRITVVKSLREMDAGAWEGCRYADVITEEVRERWQRLGRRFAPPSGGESSYRGGLRGTRWLGRLARNCSAMATERERPIRVYGFSHAGILNGMIANLQPHVQPKQQRIPHVSVTSFMLRSDGWQVGSIGYHEEALRDLLGYRA